MWFELYFCSSFFIWVDIFGTHYHELKECKYSPLMPSIIPKSLFIRLLRCWVLKVWFSLVQTNISRWLYFLVFKKWWKYVRIAIIRIERKQARVESMKYLFYTFLGWSLFLSLKSHSWLTLFNWSVFFFLIKLFELSGLFLTHTVMSWYIKISWSVFKTFGVAKELPVSHGNVLLHRRSHNVYFRSANS